MVFGCACESGDVGERDVEKHRPYAMSHGFVLAHDGQMVLRICAVGGVLAAPRIIVAAALVEEEPGELPVARIAGDTVERHQPDLLSFVFGDVNALPGSECGGDRLEVL